MKLVLMCFLITCIFSDNIRYDKYCDDRFDHPFCNNDCLKYPQFEDTDEKYEGMNSYSRN